MELPWPSSGHKLVLRLLCLCQVVPAGGSRTIYISFTPMVLSPDVLHKVGCTGYALGYMSLDNEVRLSQPGVGTMTKASSGCHASCSAQDYQ